jgi:hypothetical protein
MVCSVLELLPHCFSCKGKPLLEFGANILQ